MPRNNMRSAYNLKAEQRKQQAVAMKAEGMSAREIAKKLGVSDSIIYRYIRETMSQSKEIRLEDAEKLRTDYLEISRKVRDEAWEQWDRSKKDHERRTVKTLGKDGDDETTVMTEGQCGDPRYLKVILDSVTQDCAMLGLNAPIKLDHGKLPNILEVVVESRDELITVRQIIDGHNPSGSPDLVASGAGEVLDV